MKNAFSRFGYTCAAALVAAAITGTMFAQTANRITVNLPESVVVGSKTLAAGTYAITDLEAGSGNHVFVFRGAAGKPVSVAADLVEQPVEALKTTVVLTKEGSEVHLDKLLVEGSSIGFEFAGRVN